MKFFLMVISLTNNGSHASVSEFESFDLCSSAIESSKVVATAGADNESTTIMYCTSKKLEWSAKSRRYE